jgi:signal transduction histidine kinase
MAEIKDSAQGPTGLKILLIEDNPNDAELICDMLEGVPSFKYKLTCAARLSEALQQLEQGSFRIVLLDLNLPDSRGFDTFFEVYAKWPSTPIVVLTGLSDEMLALKAVQAGAQDYLVKGEVTGRLLVKALRYAIERQRLFSELEMKSAEITEITQRLWQSAKLATIGELAASIAHELNNPLATVSLHVESMLGQTAPDEPRSQALKVVEQEIDRMANLVANLLQFSRRSRQQISTVDVREEIDKTLKLIHFHLRKQRIAVVREFADELPVIQADRQRLRQLFLNLIINACDAMPQGGTLTIRVSATDEVTVQIIDTGVGIAPKDLPRVMEPFFTTKPEGEGTGLGLPICRRIAKEHGGKLKIASEPGRGTTVRVVLSSRSKVNGTILNGDD